MASWTPQQLAAMSAVLFGTHDNLDKTPRQQGSYTLDQIYGGIIPPSGGGLTTRTVQTVPINPVTGMPYPQSAAPPVPAAPPSMSRGAQVTIPSSQSIQPLPSGVIKTNQGIAGTVPMPRDVRPASVGPDPGFDPLAYIEAGPSLAPIEVQAKPLPPLPPGNYDAGIVKADNSRLVPPAPPVTLMAEDVAPTPMPPMMRPGYQSGVASASATSPPPLQPGYQSGVPPMPRPRPASAPMPPPPLTVASTPQPAVRRQQQAPVPQQQAPVPQQRPAAQPAGGNPLQQLFDALKGVSPGNILPNAGGVGPFGLLNMPSRSVQGGTSPTGTVNGRYYLSGGTPGAFYDFDTNQWRTLNDSYGSGGLAASATSISG